MQIKVREIKFGSSPCILDKLKSDSVSEKITIFTRINLSTSEDWWIRSTVGLRSMVSPRRTGDTVSTSILIRFLEYPQRILVREGCHDQCLGLGCQKSFSKMDYKFDRVLQHGFQVIRIIKPLNVTGSFYEGIWLLLYFIEIRKNFWPYTSKFKNEKSY